MTKPAKFTDCRNCIYGTVLRGKIYCNSTARLVLIKKKDIEEVPICADYQDGRELDQILFNGEFIDDEGSDIR